ncbi:MAG: hypothetical protein KKB79_01690 [Nanoarchaeota archaeon]|nr:hypothetical protein [Nanoarchaeota archaeon]
MKYKVIIKAEGENGSGKSYLLGRIKNFLEKEGFKVDDSSLKDRHELRVLNER